MKQSNKDLYAKILADQYAKSNAKSQPTNKAMPALPETKPEQVKQTPPPAVIPQPQPQNKATFKSTGIYSLIDANGKTMQPIKQVVLPVGCKIYTIGSEGDFLAATIEPANDNGRQKCIRLSERTPIFFYVDVKYMQPYSKKFGIGNYYADNFDLLDISMISKYSKLAKDREQQQEQTAAITTATAPELSQTTFADLFNTTEEVKPAPAPTPLQPSQFYITSFKGKDKVEDADKPQAPAPAKKNDIVMEEYSTISFVVRASKDTYPIKDQLKAKGGGYNRFLQGGPGWVFSKKKWYTIKTFIEKQTA